MSKKNLLSSEISRSRALLAGGSSTLEILKNHNQWSKAFVSGSSYQMKNWSDQICNAIEESLPLGAPIGSLLREIQTQVRKEERNLAKLDGLKKQFGFQKI